MAGAVVAKKKMMKKYGWYKHSEDGGSELIYLWCLSELYIKHKKLCHLIYFEL